MKLGCWPGLLWNANPGSSQVELQSNSPLSAESSIRAKLLLMGGSLLLLCLVQIRHFKYCHFPDLGGIWAPGGQPPMVLISALII